ncbi:neuropeptide W isoform X1 [Chelonia mydas]|uniref:neuropeptide W isoform X1 n=1 Tax=Chelonia mydas TaxID=8469 RepID=UPI0018A218A9|nr:neuropeptide W isoform X1 [Chelonia mydas]XP_043379788.1 neuropeptide W isoform X1 [Chelonia mydas]XP_043379789.1 neuropeptide W isoform X1 [Chelonia mydas]
MNLRHASGGAWKTLGLLGLMLLVHPVGAWYKHVASPRYHTVGRASGLLMGIRRSPYLWRRDLGDERGESPGSPPTSVNRAPRLLQSRRQDLRAAGPRTQASGVAAPRPARGELRGRDPAALRRLGVQDFTARRTVAQHRAPLQAGASPLPQRVRALPAQCPPGCQQGPWSRGGAREKRPALLERVMKKQQQQPQGSEEGIRDLSLSESEI